MRGLDGTLAHLGARDEAIARGDGSAQVLQAIGACRVLVRVAIAAAREKRLSGVDEHGGRGVLLKTRSGFGKKRRIGIEIAQTLADHDVADVQHGVKAARDAREDEGLGMIRADEVLRGSRGVDRAHACRGGNKASAVVGSGEHREARLLRGDGSVNGRCDFADFFFKGADDGDGFHDLTPISLGFSALWYQSPARLGCARCLSKGNRRMPTPRDRSPPCGYTDAVARGRWTAGQALLLRTILLTCHSSCMDVCPYLT